MENELKPISNALELRIDSLVFNKHKEVHRFTFMDFMNYRHPTMGGNYGFYSIPLTDQYLVNFGGEIKPFAKGILLDRFRFVWKESYSYWYVLDAHNQTYLTKIEFVHELQNFYHSMNGQELNITV